MFQLHLLYNQHDVHLYHTHNIQRCLSLSVTVNNDNFIFGGPYKYINNLEFLEPKVEDAIPIYQVLKADGTITNENQDPQVLIQTSYYFMKCLYITLYLIKFHIF